MKSSDFSIYGIIVLICLIIIGGYHLFIWSWLGQFHKNNQKYLAYCQQVDCATQVDNLYHHLIFNKDLDQSYYSSREIEHLKDIRTLIRRGVFFLLSIIIILILSLSHIVKNQKINNQLLPYGLSMAGVIILLIGLLVYLFFDYWFLQFHLLVFDNDFWLLDPAYESLIIIFPPELFLFLMVRTAGISLAFLWLLALFFTLKNKRFLFNELN